MNVGILSMQRVNNYGSLLQAYALKKTIESFGYDCGFLDIQKGVMLDCHDKRYDQQSIKVMLQKLKKEKIKAVSNYFHHRNYRKEFKKNYSSILELPEELVNDKAFDVVVIGSDEVFNFVQNSWWGFSKQLFGANIKAKKKITYAASFGWTTLDDIVVHKLEYELQNALANISSFSVRDKNSSEIIKYLTDIEPSVNLDPTLLYDFTSEMTQMKNCQDYIVLYSYRGRTDTKNEIDSIRKFATTQNKKLYSLGFYHAWCDRNILAKPFDILNYFKDADYIVTDTFHGTVFSILFKKKFCTLLRKSNTEKISFLLQQFNLSHRTASSPEQIPKILRSDIDYSQVNEILTKKREDSTKYLRESLIVY